MPLVLMTAVNPGDSYWAALPAPGLEYWNENLAGDLYPDADGDQNLGTTAFRIDSIYAGNLSLVNNSNITPDALTASIAIQNTDGTASNVNAATGSIISVMTATTAVTYPSYATRGSFVHGRITGTTSRITAGYGGLAGGQALGTASQIISSVGSIAHGDITGIDGIISAGAGGLAVGQSRTGGVIITNAGGGVALGYAKDTYYAIQSYSKGGIAMGCAFGGSIQASGEGAVAMGYATAGYSISASDRGAVAMGNAYGANITASGYGSIAMGHAGVAAISATANGSVAMGYADDIMTASAIGAFQFNGGTNNVSYSMKIGNNSNGIRIIGNGATSTRNGDLWCDGTDVFVRTGGVTKNMTAI